MKKIVHISIFFLFAGLLVGLAFMIQPQAVQAADGGELAEETALNAPQMREMLSAGTYHICVVETDGTLACWGRNNQGQATPPEGIFIQVSAGGNHTCGLKADGTLACWGLNGNGQATPPAGVFTQVNAGYAHTCGLKADGTLACWGWNNNGQATPPAGVFTQVSGGSNHTCGLKADGTLTCWGDNTYNQVTPPAGTFTQVSANGYFSCGVKTDSTLACWGDNTFNQVAPVGGLPTGSFTQVSAGASHACGLKVDGSLACWGDNAYGAATPPAGVFTQVSGGDVFTCGLKADGTLVCWGNNDYGQQASPAGIFGLRRINAGYYHTCGLRANGEVLCWGDNTYLQSTPPTGAFVQISAGNRHTCGLKTDGTLACWGENSSGKITPPAGTFVQTSAGADHNCAVKTDGTLACWGLNGNGQATPPAGTFVQVSGGYAHTCGIKTDGTLACWGRNDRNQATPPAGVQFTQVSAGRLHTCGIKTDGTLACWGYNASGQSTPPAGTFTQLSAGDSHNCGAKTDGALACWGAGGHDQTDAPAGTFIQVTSGYQHSCGLRSNDTLVCWGYNDSGQAPRLSLSPTSLPSGSVSAAYSQAVSASAGTAPYAYNVVAGSLPPGLSLNAGSGLISGSPTAAGIYAFTLQASDSFTLPLSIQQNYTLMINTPPQVVADGYTMNEDGDLDVSDPGVLVNDSDPDLPPQTLRARVSTLPLHGTMGLEANGAFTYTPPLNYNGVVTFTYIVSDSLVWSNAAMATITVTAVNDVPSFTKGPDVSVDEDSGAYSAAWATGISTGPADESGQALTFTVTHNTNPGLFSALPWVTSNGVLSFTLAADAKGSALVSLALKDSGGVANGGVDLSATQNFTITVDSINDAPSFTPGANVVVNEDSGAYSAVWATNISAGPANESEQTLAFTITENTNPSLFSGLPALAPDGTLTFTPTLNANGSVTITLELEDDGGVANGGVDTSAAHSFRITVNAVNDVPIFTKGPDVTVNEDSGAYSAAWATGISPGPADESGQTLAFTVTNNTNPSLFSVLPAVASNGTLSFTPAANANGSATLTLALKDSGGTAYGGVDTSATQTFIITVNSVNDVPVFTKGPNITVNEDSGAYSAAWATGISVGPANESTQSLTFTISGNTNPSLFSVLPAVAADGVLTFTPAANARGVATLSVRLKDSGGTANGGVDTSAPQTFVITVNSVNDAPTFTIGPDVTVDEDTGAYSAAWATDMSTGPADESGQTWAFTITGNTDPSLFSVLPLVAVDGRLTFTPAANASGSVTITLALKDNGGVANGGVDTSAPQTFLITLSPINDIPSFTKGPDVAVSEDSGAYSAAWAAGISAGPANESAQTLTFTVTGNTNPGLFSVPPAVAADGKLSFTPAVNANGSVTITLALKDSGGTAKGGVDTSPTQRFAIQVKAVNDAPTFTKGADITVDDDSGAYSAAWATNLLAGPADESAQTLAFTITNNTNPSLFSVAPALAADGRLSFTPANNAEGSATFSVRLKDNGGTADGGVDASAVQTFTIAITRSQGNRISLPVLRKMSPATAFVAPAEATVIANGWADWLSIASLLSALAFRWLRG